MSFAIFNENYYLANNPDVKAAVNAGSFSSGLQHFQQFGLAEGRVLVSPNYDEQFYLRANPDVAMSLTNGILKSGLQHYIQFGEAEDRSAGTFNEQLYLRLNPDVATSVASATFSSGLQHYIQYGQFEANRVSLFSGTTGNDIITSFGAGTKVITGATAIASSNAGGSDELISAIGEVDTLIGEAGVNLFTLGFSTAPQLVVTSPKLYVGGGNSDYALIQSFERYSDAIVLEGAIQDYTLQAINGNLNISTVTGDLIGIVQGVTELSSLSSNVVTLPVSGVGEFTLLL